VLARAELAHAWQPHMDTRTVMLDSRTNSRGRSGSSWLIGTYYYLVVLQYYSTTTTTSSSSSNSSSHHAGCCLVGWFPRQTLPALSGAEKERTLRYLGRDEGGKGECRITHAHSRPDVSFVSSFISRVPLPCAEPVPSHLWRPVSPLPPSSAIGAGMEGGKRGTIRARSRTAKLHLLPSPSSFRASWRFIRRAQSYPRLRRQWACVPEATRQVVLEALQRRRRGFSIQTRAWGLFGGCLES
jgi:hypothetical protein